MADFKKGDTVRLIDGKSATVIDADAERECLWVLVDGEQHDRRIWNREVASGVASTSKASSDAVTGGRDAG